MKKMIGAAVATVLAAGTVASAEMVLHLDINNIRTQATGPGGVNGAFGGLSHTGAVNFSFEAGITQLAGMDIQTDNGAPVNQNVTGTLANFTGTINLNNGMVTGGSLTATAGSDAYTAQITPNVGAVSTFVGGGYKIEGLTFNGMFSGGTFAGVDVSPWFNSQTLGGLLGSFLQFNFSPNNDGFAYSDLDLFVNTQVVPLPPAGWAGLATLGCVMVGGYIRRRR